MEKSQQLDESESADQRYRDRDRRNQGAAPILQKDQHDQHDEEDGFRKRLQYFADGIADKRRGVERDFVLQAGRKPLGKPVQFGADGLVDIEGIGGGQLRHADTDAVVAVEAKPGAVILRSQLRVAHVDKPDQRAVPARLQDDVVELSGIGQASDGAHADLKHLIGGGGLRADLAGSDLNVLLRQRGDDIRGGQSAGRQTARDRATSAWSTCALRRSARRRRPCTRFSASLT